MIKVQESNVRQFRVDIDSAHFEINIEDQLVTEEEYPTKVIRTNIKGLDGSCGYVEKEDLQAIRDVCDRALEALREEEEVVDESESC